MHGSTVLPAWLALGQCIVSGKTVRTISTRCGNLLESEACSTNNTALLLLKQGVSEVLQIKIITTSLLAWEYP